MIKSGNKTLKRTLIHREYCGGYAHIIILNVHVFPIVMLPVLRHAISYTLFFATNVSLI